MGLAFTGPVWGRRDSPRRPLLDNGTAPCPVALISDPRQSREAGLDKDRGSEEEKGGVCGVWVGVRQKDTGTRDDGGGDTKKGVRERGERD